MQLVSLQEPHVDKGKEENRYAGQRQMQLRKANKGKVCLLVGWLVDVMWSASLLGRQWCGLAKVLDLGAFGRAGP
jgi:hypothetical protein